MKKFFSLTKAQQLFYNFLQKVVSRKNSITGLPYSEDPTIMAWQLCNEPRPFGKDEVPAFMEWVKHSSELIKKHDPNHMVSTGSEGIVGCNNDAELCERVHNMPSIDYMTVPIPYINIIYIQREKHC